MPHHKPPVGPITKDCIESIKAASDILDVIQEFVPDLKRSGQSWKAKSPKGNDNTPSFIVTPSKRIYKDFSKGHGGDAISFLMNYQDMTYVQALEYLAKRYGIEIKREPFRPKAVPSPVIEAKSDILLDINEWACSKFEKNLWGTSAEPGSIALDHLTLRGITADHIRLFRLGYALNSFDALKDAAREELKYSYELLEEASVVNRHSDGNHFYDFFRNRVMFPICNEFGQVVGFGGRTLDDQTNVPKDRRAPKYTNSHENYIFKKNSVFFGLYQAIDHIRKAGFVYIVEGYTDVLAFHRAGVKNVVSLNGTALTENAVRMLSRYTRSFVIAMDGDIAGQKAIHYQLPILLKYASNEADRGVRIVTFPQGKDPEEMLNTSGNETFLNFLKDNQLPFIKNMITKQWKQESTPEAKAKIMKNLVSAICYVEDRFIRHEYMALLSSLTDYSLQDLEAEASEILEKRKAVMRKHLDKMAKVEGVNTERSIMKILIKFGDFMIADGMPLAKYIMELMDTEEVYVRNNQNRDLVGAIDDLVRAKRPVNVKTIGEYFPELRGFLQELSLEKINSKEIVYNPHNNHKLERIKNMVMPSLIYHMIELAPADEVRQVLQQALKTYPQNN